MSDGLTYFALVAGFGFILVAGARLGAGSHHSFAGLFPAHGVRDWPTGAQESDAPRFAVGHLDGLRPGQPVVIDASPDITGDPFDLPRAEVFDLGSRRLDAPQA